mmetsp:Transcript_21997/g.67539  ORF Transcript_21997/g.67539 Transcript_21997/m.67539 type:complete len:110 (-) Transcript_21997:312-641(-)
MPHTTTPHNVRLFCRASVRKPTPSHPAPPHPIPTPYAQVLKRSLKCSNLQKLDEIATQLEHGTPLHLVVERQLAGGGKPPRLPSPAKPKTAQVSDGEESDTPDWFPLEA